MLEEFGGHDGTHGVGTQVVRAGGAAPIPIEAGEGVLAALLERPTDDIQRLRHAGSLSRRPTEGSPALCEDSPVSHRTVHVPAARLRRWVDGFTERHGGASQEIIADALHLTGFDGATAAITSAYPLRALAVTDFIEEALRVPRTGVLLIRRGGFAAAVIEGERVVASDVGKRHVQGRTAAGGWSQQRFARRRDKQVHELIEAAVDYAVRVIIPALPLDYLATGGDRSLVDETLEHPRLRTFATVPRGPHLDVPDPRRDVVTSLPERLSTLRIDLVDP